MCRLKSRKGLCHWKQPPNFVARLYRSIEVILVLKNVLHLRDQSMNVPTMGRSGNQRLLYSRWQSTAMVMEVPSAQSQVLASKGLLSLQNR
jgi:hypothetical protein